MNPKRKKSIGLIIVLMSALVPVFVFAATSITINTNIPGDNSVTTPGGIVANFYQFALLMGGILAFGAIVWGGVKYTWARGNPSKQSEGKQWIWSALYGLLLLAGAYIVLHTINPDILGLNLPALPGITLPVATPVGPGPGNNGSSTTNAQCASGPCLSLRSVGFTCKDPSLQPHGIDSCYASQGMISTLQCIRSQPGVPPMTITEAMPPTVGHISRCHQNGCCVDIAANTTSCAQVNAILAATRACGGTAANESATCGGTSFITTTGSNIHINSAHTNGC